ncbi:hypothetical protein CQ048_05785 [Pseudomonas trivialis]|nr:hypothetical protein CQ048_05785 [Pseudomonas trivialis]PRB28441.1 hypothetical protein CQ041_05790 [Pseudomonas sp. MYb60]
MHDRGCWVPAQQQPLIKRSQQMAWNQAQGIVLIDFALSEDDLAIISRLATPAGRLDNQDPAVYEEL